MLSKDYYIEVAPGLQREARLCDRTFVKEIALPFGCTWVASLGRRGRRGRHTATTLADVVDLLVERSTNGHELCGVALLRGRVTRSSAAL